MYYKRHLNYFVGNCYVSLLIFQFVTNGEKPGGAPRNVRITGISSTSLEVTWDDPERRLLHGPITRYNLGYREYRLVLDEIHALANT